MTNQTGKWAVTQPRINHEKCTKCLRCWIVCPDSAIEIKKELIITNYFFCKGCGICKEECPVDAIRMEAPEL